MEVDIPNSLTSVKLVDANSIFCLTGAFSGTYVIAMHLVLLDSSSSRKSIYKAALSVRCGCRLVRSLEKSADVDEIVPTGVRVSGDVEILANKPREKDDCSRSWKAA